MTMEHIERLRDLLIYGMQKEFVVLGYTMTWWQVFIFDIVASIMIMLIVGFLIDD